MYRITKDRRFYMMIVRVNEAEKKEMLEGVFRENLAWGEKNHLVKFTILKNSEIPQHSHQNEQTGYLLRGRLLLAVDGREYIMTPGDSWSIPSNTSHGAKALEEVEIIEAFSPPREDYLKSR